MADTILGDFVRGISKQAALRAIYDLTDRQLLEKFIISRDDTAFAALVHRHGPLVLSVCHRVLRHQQDAEDGDDVRPPQPQRGQGPGLAGDGVLR